MVQGCEGVFSARIKVENIILLKLFCEKLLEKDFLVASISATYDTSLATYVSLACIA